MGCQQAGQEQEDDDLTGHHRFPADPFQQRWIYWRAYWQHFDAARRPGGARVVHGEGSGHPSIRYDWEGYVRHRPGWDGGSDGDLSAESEDGASVSQPGHEADFLIKASATRRFSEGSQLYARLSIHIDSHGSAPGAISSHQLPITAYAARDGGMYTRVTTIAATISPQGGVATAQVAVIDVPLSEYSKTSKYNGRSDYSTLTEHVRLVHDHPDNLSAAGYVLRVYPMGVFAKPIESRVTNSTGALYFSDEEHGRNFISGTKSFCSSFGRNVIGFREPFGVGKVWEDFLSQHSGIVTLWVEINRAMRKDGTWWNAYREAWIDMGVSDEDAFMDTFLFEIDQWPYTAGGWPGDEDSNYRVMHAVRYIIGMFLDPATVPSSFDTVVHAVRSANRTA